MNIQSLSVVVPAKRCINNCKFCVSQMNEDKYEDMLDVNNPYWSLYEQDYIKRLNFARNNGCNTMMITGDCEPQQNKRFLRDLGSMNKGLRNPFEKIEMQTTGIMLDNSYLYFLRHHVGVSTISLSISSFNKVENAKNAEMKEVVNIHQLAKTIKKSYRFNLRLSINMTKSIEEAYRAGHKGGYARFFEMIKHLYNPDQITFRKLYISDCDDDKSKWIRENTASKEFVDGLNEYIKSNGNAIQKLEFGLTKYTIDEMSTVLDDDCMSQEAKESLKYLILRPNCKLYSRWEDRGSLIF